jgi:hypothetical protein
MRLLPLLLIPLLALLLTAGGAGSELTSVYTELGGAGCAPARVEEETGSTTQRCVGVGGYGLVLLEDDARASVNLVTPGGEERPLDYWNVVTTAFSSLGPRAEWRVLRRGGADVPVALIVRVNSYSDAEAERSVRRSYLAVSKITGSEICVTDVIPPASDANLRAREAADVAVGKPCLAP